MTFTNVDLLEQQKENINPIAGGRSASKLATIINGKRNDSFEHQKAKLQFERDQFEKQLIEADEVDDPLQSYINYLTWIHDNYTQGANTDSGLINLLERCTSYFRDIHHYKNDPRYLKIWLEYTNYSDSPRDIFVYLARKEIGNQLALYYEEFANFLELNGKLQDAEHIFELGIQAKAFPLNRLNRSYENFKQRAKMEKPFNSSIRSALSLKRGSNPSEQEHSQPKKSKLAIYQDDEQDQSVLYSIFGNDIDLQLGSSKSRIKENVMNAKQWAGQILKQKSSQTSNNKIEIYKDSNVLETKRVVCFDQDKAYTLIETVGKRTEKVMINMDLIYDEEEYCLAEILAMTRMTRNPPTINSEPTLVEDERTFTIPLNDDTSKIRSQEPTITMFSKIANNEVMNMFNGVAHEYNFEEENEVRQEEDPTNYDGFVTETVDIKEVPPTPPTEQEDNFGGSSPFVTQPDDNIVDPFDESSRREVLDKLSIPLTAYPGYYDRSDTAVNRIPKFKEITKKNKAIMKGSQSAIIDYCGNDMYCLIHELGQGGYGYVYLIETGSNGMLKALKIESPASRWEFYILHQIHRRLIDNFSDNNYFIQAESLYYFKDESFLILDYCSQSTLLDVVNNYKSNVDETLCIYFTIELLKAVEILHNIGIIHGDLKADNCMIRFEHADDSSWSETFNRAGESGWEKKSIKLIDFGRGIDLSLFPENTRFVSNLSKVDEQDCPQMNNGNQWSYEADYYGLAGIIHTLLFGEYIRIEHSKDFTLKHPFKRYWQQELWSELFDLLLNPYRNEIFYEPKTLQLNQIRTKFETWLEKNSKARYLKNTIKELEIELNSINRNRVQ